MVREMHGSEFQFPLCRTVKCYLALERRVISASVFLYPLVFFLCVFEGEY